MRKKLLNVPYVMPHTKMAHVNILWRCPIFNYWVFSEKNVASSSVAWRWGNVIAFSPRNTSLYYARDGIPQNICVCSQSCSRDRRNWHVHFAHASQHVRCCTRTTGSANIQVLIHGHMWHGLAHSHTHTYPALWRLDVSHLILDMHFVLYFVA